MIEREGLTPYPVVDHLLQELISGTHVVLGDALIGLYLGGSLALGDFDLQRSDVDFVVAVAEPLSAATIKRLALMHWRITTSGLPLATELEGSYIPLRALRRHDPIDALFANIERGSDERLRVKEHHSDWVIQRHIMREYGQALLGPPACELIDPVWPEDLRLATVSVMRSWWTTPEAADAIRRAHPGYLAYVVQTMCRVLYTFAHGAVVSKPVACRWALDSLDNTLRPLIEQAQRGRIEPTKIADILAFVDITSTSCYLSDRVETFAK